MKKHAVFLRGNPRTWNHIKESIINFFNENLDMPDWYVCFWESQTTDIEQLTKDFLGSNLKYLIIKTYDFEKFDTELFTSYQSDTVTGQGTPISKLSEGSHYWKTAYLDHTLSMEKRKQELLNHFVYDTVSFIRPDIFYYQVGISPNNFDDVKNLEGFEVAGINWEYGLTVDIDGNLHTRKRSIIMGSDAWWKEKAHMSFWTNDFFYSGASIPADILGTRFFDCALNNNLRQLSNGNPHNLLGLVAMKYQFFTTRLQTLHCRLTRPNHFYYDKVQKKYILNENRPNEILPWEKVENKEKDRMYKLLDIDPNDYG